MKHFSKAFLVLCLVLLLVFTVQAAGTATTASAVAAPGSAAVTVSLRDVSWENNGKVILTYPTTLTLTSAETGLEGALTALDTETSGEIIIYWAGESGKTAPATLLTAVFEGAPGTYTLTVQVPELGDSRDVETYDLTVTVGEACMNGHTYELTERVEPTETEDGYEVYTCSVCGDSYRVVLPAPGCPSLKFRDLSNTAWYHEEVDYALRAGLMQGVTEDLFSPNGKSTRGQLVTILYRLEGSPEVTGTSPFADVTEGRYYTDAVIWAAEHEIVNGVTETLFLPNKEITREQLVTILYRYAAYQGADTTAGETLSGFPDGASVSQYAVPAMNWAVKTGLIVGTEGKLAPKAGATRAQVATVMMRLCQEILK